LQSKSLEARVIGHRARPLLARDERWNAAHIMLYSMILIGIALRVIQFATGRSFWIDEARLALNVTTRGFAGLLQPLDYDQGAPLVFLLLEKLIMLALGNHDWVFRLLPLACGIASLLLMVKAANLVLRPTGSMIAVGLFAITGPLVYYSSEFKQYSSDVFITLLIFLLVHRCLQPDSEAKLYISLIVVGAIAIWSSHPALFILGGAGLALLLKLITQRPKRWQFWAGALVLVWAANALMLYITLLKPLATSSYLADFWSDHFMPMPPWANLGWLATSFFELFKSPVGLGDTPAVVTGMALFCVGCVYFIIYQKRTAIVFLTPFVLALIASGLKVYPFDGRLLLFCVPIVLLVIGAAIDWLCALTSKWKVGITSALCCVLAILLLYRPMYLAIDNVKNPNMKEHIKPLMAYLSQHLQPDDVIYVYYDAFPAYAYYAPQYGLGQKAYLVGIKSRHDPSLYLNDLQKLAASRTWFVFSHNCYACDVNEEAYYIAYLDKVATLLDTYSAPGGASAYLYQLAPVSSSP
jgi:hypothetical protein